MVTLILGISRLQRELHGNQLIKKSCKMSQDHLEFNLTASYMRK